MCVLGFYLASVPPHLVSDLTCGMLVVLIPFYLFPTTRPLSSVGASGNLHCALHHLTRAFLAVLVVVLFWPWASILLWPATCYALVSYAYIAGGPGVFRKVNGKLDWAAAMLLAPHVWASRSSLPYLRRRVEPWVQAAPNVFFGRLLSDREPLPPEIVAVLDLNAEQNEPERLLQFAYRNIAVLDQTLPTPTQLSEAVSFVEKHAAMGSVYIHCTFGYSRSAGIAAAYLVKTQLAATGAEAAQKVSSRRPQVSLSHSWLRLLEDYRAALDSPVIPVVELRRATQESSSRR